MQILIAIISIGFIAGLATVLRKWLRVRLCPVCAGVAGTWIWLLAAKYAGYPVDILIPSILMGGSVVGIAYQMEKKLLLGSNGSPALFWWKILFIPTGFAAVYGLLLARMEILIPSLLAVIAVSAVLFLLRKTDGKSDRQKELVEKMEDCC